MNDLNKELCEICGIKKRCHINDGRIFDCIGRDSCEGCSQFKYPDFSDPTNFCKLINIIYKCGINQPYDYQLATLAFDEEYYNDEELSDTFEKRYLQTLIFTLSKNYDNWDKEFSKIIKQTIKNTNWDEN